MNSKLVASTCNKVWGWFADEQSQRSTSDLGVTCFGKRLGGEVAWMLTCFLIAFLTIPTTAQTDCVLTCDDQKNISIGTEGYSIVFPELVINGDFSCATPITVEVLDASGFSIGDTLRCEQVGQTLTVKVVGAKVGNEPAPSCWSTVKVEDKLASSIFCEDKFVPFTASLDPEYLGYPSLRDNCSSSDIQDLQYFDLFTEFPCGTIEQGREINARITRSWTITDQFGNYGFCTQSIYLVKGYTNNVVFPGDYDGITHDVLSCDDDPNDLTITGAPTINGLPVENTGSSKFFVNYQDQQIDICAPASYRLLRRWELIDLCTKQVKVHIQEIIFEDNTEPELVCPESITVSANAINCTAAIVLPHATAYDACSGVVIQPTWDFGDGYGPFTDVPGGAHLVSYTATDECGNFAICAMEIVVEDNSQPVAVCRDVVHVALNDRGLATVSATVFDGGSVDNCAITYIEVKKEGEFAEYVTFDCNDIGTALPVILRVHDSAGLYNDCQSQVTLDDEVAPIVICPPTATISCTIDYTDINLTGAATATDECAIQTIYPVDGLDFNACGTAGTVLRNWFAEDLAGNIGTCTQLINVVDDTPLEFIFPKEYTTYECGSDLSPSTTGELIIIGEDCEDLLVSHEDETFELGTDGCIQIVRTWKVVDWCKFSGSTNSTDGLFTYNQVINVLDWTNPEITFCPEDITVALTTFDCETRVELPLLIATDCNTNLTYLNDSPYADINKEDASGMYSEGTTKVTYTVSDGCGNSSSCAVNITVKDEQAPTPVCKHSISVALRSDGTVIVPHNAINSGSYDNCGSVEQLTYEIEPNYFTCDEVGQQTINLIVTDAYGNSDFCTTDIFIQDNHDNCNPNGFSAIGGRVITEGGEAMEEVAVEITGSMSDMRFTNTEGAYLFQKLSKLANYSVRPTTHVHSKEGISTYDLVLIQKHILDDELLDSPYKIIAADVNNSGSITTFDMVLLRKMILGSIDEFPNNEPWRYVLAAHEFPDNTNPFTDDFPEHLDYNQLLGSELDNNFIGIKIGDVNNSASPSAMVGGSRNQQQPFQLSTAARSIEAGRDYHIPIQANSLNELLGYQLTLQYDTDQLQIKEVIPGEPANMSLANFGFTHMENGFLTTSWEQISNPTFKETTTLFTLVVTAKKPLQLSQAIRINSTITTAEAYTQAAEIVAIDLNFTNTPLELFQNQPNPFQQETRIGFQLPQATTGTLSIHDMSGRILKTYNGQYNAGYNEITINLDDITISNGVFYYQLETPITKRLSKKMIVLR